MTLFMTILLIVYACGLAYWAYRFIPATNAIILSKKEEGLPLTLPQKIWAWSYITTIIVTWFVSVPIMMVAVSSYSSW